MSNRMEQLRGGRGSSSRRSAQGGSRLRYGHVVRDEEDARALSSASTPVHNVPAGSKALMSAGRMSFPLPQTDKEDEHLSTWQQASWQQKLPRQLRDGPAQAVSASMNGRPARLSLGGRTPTRDENEAPNKGSTRFRNASERLPSPSPKSLPGPSPQRSPQNKVQFQVGKAYPVVDGRLYWASVRMEPDLRKTDGEHWFTTDRTLIYCAFCADFGPMNLSAVYRYVRILREKMANPELRNEKIVSYTGATPQLRTNCVFLLGCYLCLEMKLTPEEVWEKFSSLEPSPFMGYRDATYVRSTWDLQLVDCWRGLVKGIQFKLINFDTFNPDEYDYYDQPQQGDMHVMVPGKFIAFKGPTNRRIRLAQNLYSHTPKDYVEVFRHHKVSAVVRLNSKEYNRDDFVKNQFNHYDLFFEDCTTPNEALVQRFMKVADEEKGVIAVHCLAGLGRTGTLIGLWMMKHYDFTAPEVIAYLRILRPGSIIGPQQQYLCAAAARIRSNSAAALGPITAGAAKQLKQGWDTNQGGFEHSSVDSQALAQEVTNGMLRRHMQRAPAKETVKCLDNSQSLSRGGTPGRPGLRHDHL